MKHSVCAVTGSRAEFGLLRPLLEKMNSDENIELHLVITGSHLNKSFGKTIEEIENSKLPVREKIEIPLDGDSKKDMAKTIGTAVIKFADYFSADLPELLVVLGDRYEIFAAATAAAVLNIPIAHIHGGETTQGAIDEFLRHSITKMSMLHFTACEEYRRRVIQLGELPQYVYNVGGLGVENFLSTKPMSLEELQESIDFPLAGHSFSIVTFHPVTLEDPDEKSQIYELISAMDIFSDMRYIITLANADAGGRFVNQIWQQEAEKHKNWRVIPSLGLRRYMTALRYAEIVLGNSSSGILEAPAAHIPTVNIGDRQKGRVMAESIICCGSNRDDITEAMKKAFSAEFKEAARHAENPFGDGNTSEKIMSVISDHFREGKRDMKKKFYDIPFEI